MPSGRRAIKKNPHQKESDRGYASTALTVCQWVLTHTHHFFGSPILGGMKLQSDHICFANKELSATTGGESLTSPNFQMAPSNPAEQSTIWNILAFRDFGECTKILFLHHQIMINGFVRVVEHLIHHSPNMLLRDPLVP